MQVNISYLDTWNIKESCLHTHKNSGAFKRDLINKKKKGEYYGSGNRKQVDMNVRKCEKNWLSVMERFKKGKLLKSEYTSKENV